MISVVWTIQHTPEQSDYITQANEERLKPLLKNIAGFKQYLALTDHNKTKTMVIVLWESEAASAELRSSNEFQEFFISMNKYFEAWPAREFYEVSAQF